MTQGDGVHHLLRSSRVEMNIVLLRSYFSDFTYNSRIHERMPSKIFPYYFDDGTISVFDASAHNAHKKKTNNSNTIHLYVHLWNTPSTAMCILVLYTVLIYENCKKKDYIII